MNHQALQTWKGLQAILENITSLFCWQREKLGAEKHPNAPLPAMVGTVTE